jgi:hypothetical protein
MKKAALFIIKLVGAVLGLAALFDLFHLVFEYGEGIADLSNLEIALFVVFLGLERRCLTHVRDANGSFGAIVFKQMAYFGWIAFIVASIVLAPGATALSLGFMASLLASVILRTTPRRQSPPVSPEVAA